MAAILCHPFLRRLLTPPRHARLARRAASSLVCDERDFRFQLKLLKVDDLGSTARFEGLTAELCDATLDAARTLAEEKFAPHNRKNDLHEPQWDGVGEVTIIPEVKEALDAFFEAGFGSVHAAEEHGGLALPITLTNSLLFPFYAANIGTMTVPMLTIAAGNMLARHGSPDQVKAFLPKMLSGDFYGTMNLSETQAGSSLGDITTKAIPISGGAPGRYSISGSKMWISSGEHSMSENIVHMVLAKVGDPNNSSKVQRGVKGISLFLVPKRRLNEDGSVGELNDVALAGLNHKMGWRGLTNCVMSYGEEGDCEGTLIGEEGRGLATMFAMMNEARIQQVRVEGGA